MVKRHTRPQQVAGASHADGGRVIEREAPIHVSNVMLLDGKGNPDPRADRARGRQARTRRQDDRREARLR